MSERPRRLVFGEVAEAYDAARPGYPEELVSDVLAYSGAGVGDRVLEVGAGTGKASRLFAARGVALTCLEPSAAMADVLREAVPNIGIEEVGYEEFVARVGSFSLVFSAQAWHWVDPSVRYAKAHQLLAPGGALALFWNRPDWDSVSFGRELDAVYETLAPGVEELGPTRAGGHTRGMDEAYPRQLDESGLFGDITVREYPWTETYSSTEYTRLLGTHSDHRLLAEDLRERLLAELAAVIDRHGGELSLTYVTRLYLARPV